MQLTSRMVARVVCVEGERIVMVSFCVRARRGNEELWTILVCGEGARFSDQHGESVIRSQEMNREGEVVYR